MHGKYSPNYKEDARTAEQPRTGAAGLLRRVGSACASGQLPPPSVKVPADPGGLATPWRRSSSPLAPILPSTHCSPGLLVLASLSWPPCPSLPGLPGCSQPLPPLLPLSGHWEASLTLHLAPREISSLCQLPGLPETGPTVSTHPSSISAGP